MEKKPKLSVIIPTYNQKKYITECLDSIYCQKGMDFEVIVVDDGSTDGTADTLREYAKAHSSLRVLTEENRGAGAARNRGLRCARGEFVLFMDSDDFLEAGAFDIIDRITEMITADVYLYNFKTYDDKSGKTDFQPPFKELDSILTVGGEKYRYAMTSFEKRKEFFIWSFVAPWTKILRRSFVVDNSLKFDELFSTNDRTFHFASLIKSSSVVILDACLINYRINNSDSLTGSYNPSKFNNRKKAYFSTLRFIDKGDRLLSEAFFKVTVLDFVSFFQKTDASNKYEVFLETVKFFKSLDVSGISCIHDEGDRFGFLYNFFVRSEYLLNMGSACIVPVIFATNEKYLPYLAVSIRSLVENSAKESFYDVYVLHTGISELNLIKLCGMGEENVHIRAVDMSVLTRGLPLYEKGHFSVEMYYRILIPELLWQYGKVLYIDCDTVIRKDPSELLSVDLGDNVIGAVRNPLDNDMRRYVTRILNVDENEYFNSGVLIISTDSFKKNGIRKKCFDILKEYKNLACPDQDILNISCKSRCVYLDSVWNFQVGNHSYTTAFKYEKLSEVGIIHYTTGNKPWNTKGLPLSEPFWAYARKTPYYEDILLNFTSSVMRLRELGRDATQGVETVRRNVINSKEQGRRRVINPHYTPEKSWVSWPFRFALQFFRVWKRRGFVSARYYARIKIRYVWGRITKKVDRENNSIIR